MALVREDEHGLYLVVNATVFRPSTPLTQAVKGENVKANKHGKVSLFEVPFIKVEQWNSICSLEEYKEKAQKAGEWPEWADFIGNTYRPGDYVCYSVPGGLCFGRVLRINRFNSSGQRIVIATYDRTTQKRGNKESCSVTIEPIEYSAHSWRASRKVTVTDIQKIVKVEGSYMQKFDDLEKELVDAEWERIKEKYA